MTRDPALCFLRYQDDGVCFSDYCGVCGVKMMGFVSCRCNLPQSAVLGHCFGSGFVSGLQQQLEVLQVTAPGLPDAPAAIPHLVVVHPVGSPCNHLPDK